MDQIVAFTEVDTNNEPIKLIDRCNQLVMKSKYLFE
jgi:hypothetical protein